MIQIYAKGNTRYEMNGDMVLFPKSCTVSAELNGTWKLDLVHPRDQEDRWRYIEEECVISVPTFMGERQLFRIREVEKTDDEVTAVALPVFMDSEDDWYLMDIRPTNKNGQDALDIMTAGSKYSGTSNITAASTAYFVTRSLADAINGSDDPTFIGRWGGEILYDNYKIIINERVGGDYGVEVRYGKNLEGIEYYLDMSGVVTRIIPMAYNGYMMSGDSPWVDSPNISKYEKQYIRKIKFDNVKMREDVQEEEEEGVIVCDTQEDLDAALTVRCSHLFEDGLDLPVISINITMAELSGTEEYQDYDYDILEKVGLGDDVRCYHKELGITTKERVIELTWDCCRNRVEKLTLGSETYDYFSSTDSSFKDIDTILGVIGGAIDGNGSVDASKVKGFLDATKTQLRLQNSVAKKQIVRAILFEDLDPESELYGAMSLGTQGLQIAKRRTADNRDWDWGTAITANGMVGNYLVTGTISDKRALNTWNLDTGEMRMHALSIVADTFSLTSGATIDSIAKEIAEEKAKAAQEKAEKELNAFVSAVYNPKMESLQSQIDGQIETWYYDYEPTLNNVPASNWKTEADRARHEGDLFYWKSKGYSYRFLKEGSTWKWQIITDSDITKALADASKAQDTADAKRRVFITTPVPPYDAGDLWVQGADGDIMRCKVSRPSGSYVASDWIKASKYTDDSALTAFIDGEFKESIGDLQEQADKKAETWYQTSDPSTAWTTTDLKNEHKGDIWFNSTASIQKSYRWSGTAWVEMKTTPPDAVFDKIDGKAQVFIATPQPPYDVGDLWFNSATADIMTCVKKRDTGNYTTSDWEKRNKYIDQEAAETIAGNAVSAQTQTDILRKLSNNGKDDGIYLQDGKLYISLSALLGEELTIGGKNNKNGFIVVLDKNGAEVGRIDNTGGAFNSGTFRGVIESISGGIKTVIENGKIRVAYTDEIYTDWIGASAGSAGGSEIKTYGDSAVFRIGVNGTVMATFGWTPNVAESPVNYGGKCLYFPTGIYSANSSYMNALYFATGQNNNGYITGSRNTIVAHTNFNAQGTLSCSGTKSRVVDTEDYQERLLYCYEMASPIFGDLGSGVIDESGICIIQLDDILLETIDFSMEYHVFLQKEGPGDLWVLKKELQYFMVEGTPGLPFSWEVKMRQHDSSLIRLEKPEEEEEEPYDYELEYMNELEESRRKIGEMLYEDFK